MMGSDDIVRLLSHATQRQFLEGPTSWKSPLFTEPSFVVGSNWRLLLFFRRLINQEQLPESQLDKVVQLLRGLANVKPDWPVLECDVDPLDLTLQPYAGISLRRANLLQAYAEAFLAMLEYFHGDGRWNRELLSRAIAGFSEGFANTPELNSQQKNDSESGTVREQFSPAIESLLACCPFTSSPGFWILFDLVRYCDIRPPTDSVLGRSSIAIPLLTSCIGENGEPVRGRIARLVVELSDFGPTVLTPDPVWAGLTVLKTDADDCLLESVQNVWKSFCKRKNGYRGRWRLEPISDDELLFVTSFSGRSMEAAFAIALLEAESSYLGKSTPFAVDPRVAISAMLECESGQEFLRTKLKPLPMVDGKMKEICRQNKISRVIFADRQEVATPFIRDFYGHQITIEQARNVESLWRKASQIGSELSKFRLAVTAAWANRWTSDADDGRQDEGEYFVSDRRVQILSENEIDPIGQIASRNFRSADRTPENGADSSTRSWHDWSIQSLLAELKRDDASRNLVVCEAGYGKSTVLKFLEASINQCDENHTAFFIELTDLPDDPREVIANCMLNRIRQLGLTLDYQSELVEELERHREQGSLILLLDALDQSSRPESLRALLVSEHWQHCSIVITGRPYSVIENRRVFENDQWRVAAIEKFTPHQLKQFLGDWYNKCPKSCLDIARVPRFAEAIQRIPKEKLSNSLSPSQIYFYSLEWLLHESIGTSDPKYGIPSGGGVSVGVEIRTKEFLVLLAAIAFEMTRQHLPVTEIVNGIPKTIGKRPNFNKVKKNQIDAFKRNIFDRLRENGNVTLRYDLSNDRRAWRQFHSDLETLASLDIALESGVDEEIEFQNRSLQEFLTALWLSAYATEEDCREIYEWIYLPMFPQTHEYYWVWLFLTEMGVERRVREVWPRSIANLFRRGDGHSWHPHRGDGCGTKRSTEMMFRCFQHLFEHASEGWDDAQAILSDFYSEFEECVLASPATKPAAEALRDSFMEMPGNIFQMGSPSDQQIMPRSLKSVCEGDLDLAKRALDEGQYEEYFAQWLDRQDGTSWATVQLDTSPHVRDRQICYWKELIRIAASEGDIAYIENELYPKDESRHEITVDPFQIGRTEVFNAWYRLFDPSHGTSWPPSTQYSSRQSGTVTEEEKAVAHQLCYGSSSTLPADDQQPDGVFPVYLISFFDAEMFARWLRWDNKSCRLPSEAEWEYVAKYGVDPDLPYWWGQIPDAKMCVYDDIRHGVVTAHPSRANPETKRIDPKALGVMDMLGNVWEWCQDIYEVDHTGKSLSPSDAVARRVLRGGAADKSPQFVRMSRRNSGEPGAAGQKIGIRLVRDPS